MIFCGGIGLLWESIKGNSFNRYAERSYQERKRKEEEQNRKIRIIKRFEKEHCIMFPDGLIGDEFKFIDWIADYFNISEEELTKYSIIRLKEILPNINTEKPSGYMSWVGAAIRMIDDGKLPEVCYGYDYGYSLFGHLSKGIYYCLGERGLEDLSVWAARKMRDNGIPIALVYKGPHSLGVNNFNPLIYVDFYLDPIKCAKRYGIDDT